MYVTFISCLQSESFRGHLAAARTEGEQIFLMSLVPQGQFWIGANSRMPDNIWRWNGHDEVKCSPTLIVLTHSSLNPLNSLLTCAERQF